MSFAIPGKALEELAEQGWQPGDPVIQPEGEQPQLPIEDAATAAHPDADIPWFEEPTPAPGRALGGEAHARADDPGTSRAAASSVTDLGEKQRAVLMLFEKYGRMTDEQVAVAYGCAEDVPPQQPSGLRTRRAELVALGYLMDTDGRERLPTGRYGIVWGRTAVPVP